MLLWHQIEYLRNHCIFLVLKIAEDSLAFKDFIPIKSLAVMQTHEQFKGHVNYTGDSVFKELFLKTMTNYELNLDV